ncbi:MAG: hypothetical protein ACOYPR_00840 [Saprospiraceae bacterium]|jgi:hypothetical protein
MNTQSTAEPDKNRQNGSVYALFRHWYFLFHATLWLSGAFIRAAWYFKTRAMRDLQLPHPELLTSKEKRRLQHYFYGTTYLSIVFCSLRGRTRSPDEKNLFSNLAALAYFFDDLADVYHNQDQSGQQWQDNPEIYGQATDPRGLALHFLQNINSALPDQDQNEFKKYMHRVFNVETEGRQISANVFNTKELDQIAADKGGYSVLMFRRILANTLSEAEKHALYKLGHLIQTCDDIFDVWFDQKDGIKTLPLALLEAGNITDLKLRFEQFVAETYWAFMQVRPEKISRWRYLGLRHARTSWAVVHYLVTVTRVCLQHYQNLQKKHGTLPLTDRHQIVVDMERWDNRFKSVFYLISKT